MAWSEDPSLQPLQDAVDLSFVLTGHVGERRDEGESEGEDGDTHICFVLGSKECGQQGKAGGKGADRKKTGYTPNDENALIIYLRKARCIGTVIALRISAWIPTST